MNPPGDRVGKAPKERKNKITALYHVFFCLQGNFGEVFRGYFRGGIVAVKTCKEELQEDQKKKFIGEGRILRRYDHPNIVRFVGIAAQKNPVMIVMEYVSG